MFLNVILAALLAVGGLFSAVPAGAQSYPDRPVRIVVPFTPGSPNDVVARVLAPPLSARLGQPVIIENRPGGSTTIGVKSVLAGERDGHTLLAMSSPTLFLGSLVNEAVTFDPLKELVPVSTVGSTALVMVLTQELSVTSVKQLVIHANANPGTVNFGFGRGTLPHLVGESFKMVTGADIASIPYRGGAQAVTDMLGGRIQMNLGAGARCCR